MDNLFPWEQPDRGTWRCRECGFRSPEWNGAAVFDLCVPCEAAQRFEARAPLRAAIEVDRKVNARGAAICVGAPELVRETERAILLEWPSGVRSWVPRSCVVEQAEDGEVWVAGWFHAKQLAQVIGDVL
jgi:hypothetical protein